MLFVADSVTAIRFSVLMFIFRKVLLRILLKFRVNLCIPSHDHQEKDDEGICAVPLNPFTPFSTFHSFHSPFFSIARFCDFRVFE